MTADGLVPVSERPLALHKRRDLLVFPQRFAGRTVLTIKDPLTLRYYHFQEEEFFVFQQLDGATSPAQIQDAVRREFAPRRLSLRELQAFVGMLHREGLIASDAEGQGATLLARRNEVRRRTLYDSLGNILAVRFRGFDPEPLLETVYPKLRWLFSWPFLLGLASLVAAALLLVLIRFDQIVSRLPETQAYLRPENLLWLAVAIACTKVVHELAHGLACKHFGGQCREAGVMLLAFMPCLYVNVSDAWTLPNKWQRIAISGAGVIAELGLAAGCTFVWWFSQPGLLNSLCLHVMIVCSVSTVVFNGNPLLRYDGYYVLSDLLEVPNLGPRASRLLWRVTARILLGVDLGGERLSPSRHRFLLVGYALASAIYRVLVIIAILWFFHSALKPLGLQAAVQLLTLVVVSGMIVPPLWRVARFFSNPAWAAQVNRARWTITTLAAVSAAVGLLVAPVPQRVTAPAVVRWKDAARVYVSVPGAVEWSVDAGSRVQQGQRLAVLANPELGLQVIGLRGECDFRRAELDSLKQRSAQQVGRAGKDLQSQIPAAEKALQDVQQRLERLVEEQQRLTLTAPVPGQVLPPRRRPAAASIDQLPTWEGDPTDPRNRNAYLSIGTVFCLIGDPDALEAVLVVEQADVERIKTDQRVRVQLDQLPGRYLRGRVREVAKLDADAPPPELVAAGKLPVRRSAGEGPQLGGISYLVRVEFEEPPEGILPGGVGRAKIRVSSASLGKRIIRYLSETFRFRL